MSQKTNPLSLRLENNNRNFCSPWFTDFFFADNFRYQLQVDKYIKAVLKDNLYSVAFFSAKSYYRKFNFLIAIQDTRALKKEKQMLFNIKSFLLPNLTRSKKYDQSKLLQSRKKNFALQSNKIPLVACNSRNARYKNLSFRENIMLSKIFNYNSGTSHISCTGSIMKKTNHNFAQDLKYSIRKKVVNNFLKVKQNYNLQTLNSLEIFFSFINNNFFQNKIRNRDSLFFFPGHNTWSKSKPAQINRVAQTNRNLQALQEIVSKKVRIPILSYSDKSNSSFRENCKQDLIFCDSITTLRKNEINFSTGITNIQPIRFINYTQNVVSLLDLIALLLEKRVSFSRVKTKILKDILKMSNIKGVRITCSGRLGGRSKKAQKAKTQSYQWGESCLNTFSSKVAFAKKSIITSYGKIGIKVWVCYANSCETKICFL